MKPLEPFYIPMLQLYMLPVWLPASGANGRGWPLVGEALWEEVRKLGSSHKGLCPWRGYWDPSPFLSLCLFPGCHEVNRPPPSCTPILMYCLATGPKATGPSNHELNPLKLWARINFSSLVYFSQVFCHSRGMLANTTNYPQISILTAIP
jgi:hypothetical protein